MPDGNGSQERNSNGNDISGKLGCFDSDALKAMNMASLGGDPG
jgi:hypothetical protein